MTRRQPAELTEPQLDMLRRAVEKGETRMYGRGDTRTAQSLIERGLGSVRSKDFVKYFYANDEGRAVITG